MGLLFFVTLLNERYTGLLVAVLVCMSDVPRSSITLCSVFVFRYCLECFDRYSTICSNAAQWWDWPHRRQAQASAQPRLVLAQCLQKKYFEGGERAVQRAARRAFCIGAELSRCYTIAACDPVSTPSRPHSMRMRRHVVILSHSLVLRLGNWYVRAKAAFL